MKKRIILTMFLALFAVIAIFAQTTDSDLTDALAANGVARNWAWMAVTVIGVVIGKIWKQKWADPLAVIIRIAKVVIVVLEWLNDKVNNASVVQKCDRAITGPVSLKKAVGPIFRVLVITMLLSGIGVAANAQGLFKPVTIETINKATLQKSPDEVNISQGVWLWRINAQVVATEYRLSETTSEFERNDFSKTAIGVAYAHYIPSNGEAFNNYSVNALLFLPMKEDSDFAIGVTGTVMKYLSGGVCYNFDAGRDFKHNLGLLVNVGITF